MTSRSCARETRLSWSRAARLRKLSKSAATRFRSAEVLVALALEEREALLELGDRRLGLVVGAGLLLGGHYDCFASSSMTS